MATGLFLLGRLQAFQLFRLTPGLLPEHRIRKVHRRVRPHLILRSFLGLAPAADLEAAVPGVQAADSAAEAMRVAGDAWEEPEAADTAAAADNPHVWTDFPINQRP